MLVKQLLILKPFSFPVFHNVDRAPTVLYEVVGIFVTIHRLRPRQRLFSTIAGLPRVAHVPRAVARF